MTTFASIIAITAIFQASSKSVNAFFSCSSHMQAFFLQAFASCVCESGHVGNDLTTAAAAQSCFTGRGIWGCSRQNLAGLRSASAQRRQRKQQRWIWGLMVIPLFRLLSRRCHYSPSLLFQNCYPHTSGHTHAWCCLSLSLSLNQPLSPAVCLSLLPVAVIKDFLVASVTHGS